MFNRLIDDHENWQRVRWAVGNSRIDHKLRDRTHVERMTSLGFFSKTTANGATTIDYQVLGAYSDQFDPLTMTAAFREPGITFAPNVTSSSIDPDNVQTNPQNREVARQDRDAETVGAHTLEEQTRRESRRLAIEDCSRSPKSAV